VKLKASERDLLRLVASAHDAATDPSLWREFLQKYATLVSAGNVVFQRHDMVAGNSQLLATVGMNQEFIDLYNDYYGSVNVWRKRGRHLYTTGRVIQDEELCSRSFLVRSEFFNDYLVPNHGTRSLAAVIWGDEGSAVTLAAQRDEGQPSWTPEDRRTVEVLLPHVTRAYKTAERMQTLDSAAAVVNALTYGVVFVGRHGRATFCNLMAEEIFRANDGLTVKGGVVRATDTATNAALQQAIAYMTGGDASLVCPPPVVVRRPSGRAPYHVSASPFRATAAESGVTVANLGVVLISDPERRHLPSADALRVRFGLTPRETALAMHLAEGCSLEHAADRLGMRYETARTHLRRIFGKTSTSRQAELVALLTRLGSPVAL